MLNMMEATLDEKNCKMEATLDEKNCKTNIAEKRKKEITRKNKRIQSQ